MALSATSILFAKSRKPSLSKSSLRKSPNSILSHHNGCSSKLPTHLQGRQVRHDRRRLELQHVPFRASFSHLRVLQLQIEDMPTMRIKGIGKPYFLGWLFILATCRKAAITSDSVGIASGVLWTDLLSPTISRC